MADELTRYLLPENPGQAFLYHGTSMRGTFRHGDVLLVTPADPSQVHPGDILAFFKRQADGSDALVTHRVQRRTTRGFITRGDNNAAPDPGAVSSERLVGRIDVIHRRGRACSVRGGRVGLWWAAFLRLRRRLLRAIEAPYRFLGKSGLARLLWRPRLQQVCLLTEQGPLIKYVHGRQTVASWWPRKGQFLCRKPYDLVIPKPGETGSTR